MDREDIRDLRRWFRAAFRRSQQAGFDLICLYGAHGFGILQHFLSRATNQRTDEYGGSLDKPRRGSCARSLKMRGKPRRANLAITLRMSLHEAGTYGFSNAELRDFIEMHGDLPDLWDLAHGTWEACSGTSRFKPEGAQEDLVKGIKAADVEARRRRRPLHLARRDGAADQGRHPRLHRRGTALASPTPSCR